MAKKEYERRVIVALAVILGISQRMLGNCLEDEEVEGAAQRIYVFQGQGEVEYQKLPLMVYVGS